MAMICDENEDILDTFQHRKKARKLARFQVQAAVVSIVAVTLLLVLHILPLVDMDKGRRRGRRPGPPPPPPAPGGTFVSFIGLVIAFGIASTASLTGSYNLYSATQIGTDPTVALGLIKLWKVCGHVSRAAIIVMMILVPFIDARVIVGLVCLLVIGLVVASAFMGSSSKRVERYVEELKKEDLTAEGERYNSTRV